MLDDLAKTVKAQLYERVSSPLIGAFTLSWLAWNYRFVLVILSSMSVQEKFAYIDTSLFGSYQTVLLHGALYPALTTLALIFIYPIPAKFVYEYWRKRQRELKEIQQRIDDETPLTREEARELRHETLNARLEFEQELGRRSDEIARLKETIKELQPIASPSPIKQIKAAQQKKEDASSATLDNNQVQMLKSIAESANGLQVTNLISSSGNERIRAEYNLGELEEKKYASRDFETGRGYVVRATHLGRSYLIKHT